MNKRKINKEACVLQSHWNDNHKKQNISSKPSPHVSEHSWNRRFLSSVLALRPHVNGVFRQQKLWFSKTVLGVEFFENAGWSFLCERTKMTISYIIQPMPCKGWYRIFIVLVFSWACERARTSLRSKRFQSSHCAKVRAGAKKRWKGEGEGRKVSFFPLPVPRHFCFRPDILDELARKRLLRRLGEN